MDFSTREANTGDASALSDLCGQLGYPLTQTDILQNLHAILEHNNEKIFTAMHENKVIGWIGVIKTVHLTTGHLCELSGLVVDKQYHRKGVGKLLIEKAKEWSKMQGVSLLRVRANVIRKEAHQFYHRQGFKELKEQKVFETNLY